MLSDSINKTIGKFVCSFILFVTFFAPISSCNFKGATFSDAANWIPSDFNPNNSVLLVETHPYNKKQNANMVEFLEKNYPYKYEVVDSNAIKDISGKYADTKKYQFAVRWEFKGVWRTRTGANGMPSQDREYDLYGNFVDRLKGKTYPTTQNRNVAGVSGYKPFFQSVTKKFK